MSIARSGWVLLLAGAALAALGGCDRGSPYGPMSDAGVCWEGSTVCNDVHSDRPIACCWVETQKCCDVGFEHQECLARDEPCPSPCPRSDTYCPASLPFCEVRFPAAPEEPSTCDDRVEARCAADCPVERQCGRECCGAHAVCVDGCCVPDPAARLDAGLR